MKTFMDRLEKSIDQLSLYLRSHYFTFAFTLLAFWTFISQTRKADPDLFARTAMGRLFIRDGIIPLEDPFAFTPVNSQWIDHEWLSGVLFYLTSQVFGDPGLYFGKFLLLGLTLLFIMFSQSLYSGKPAGRIIWFLTALMFSFYGWLSTVRCQVLSFLFLAILIFLFEKFRKDKKLLPLLCCPLLMVVWANCHGGFVVGLGFIGFFVLGRLLTAKKGMQLKLISILTLSTLAILINPYGWDYVSYIIHATTMARPEIAEWQPMPFFSLFSMIRNSMLILFVLDAVLNKRKHPLEVYLMVFSSWGFALRSGRLGVFFMLIMCIYGASSLETIKEFLEKKLERLYRMLKRIFSISVIGAFLAIVPLFISSFTGHQEFRLDYSFYPVQIIETLRSNRTKGKLLADFGYGSYILWRLYPDMKVATDGRYEEVYPNQTFNAAIAALDPDDPDNRQALEYINPDYILTRKEIDYFGSDWKTIMSSEAFVLKAKKSSEKNFPEVLEPLPDNMWDSRF